MLTVCSQLPAQHRTTTSIRAHSTTSILTEAALIIRQASLWLGHGDSAVPLMHFMQALRRNSTSTPKTQYVQAFQDTAKPLLYAVLSISALKMCAPSRSGAGGIALYRYMSQGKTYDFSSKGASSSYRYTENEPLGSLQASGEQAWFNGKFMEFRDVNQLPMDQHMLGSLCCDPNRYLFIIGSCVGEDWVNAPSMWMSYCGMKHIWDYVGLSDHLAINIHKEGHAVIAEDVQKMIQFFDYHVYGIQPTMNLDELKTSVFELPKNKDPYQDSFTSKWLY